MNKFKQDVIKYIKIHQQLHGASFDINSVANDLHQSFMYGITDCIKQIRIQLENQAHTILDDKKYGVIIGRFQPFHNGHQAIINEIILDGRTPIIVLGSKSTNNSRNPLTFDERIELIKLIYPHNVIFLGVNDYPNDDTSWFNEIVVNITSITDVNNCTFYTHDKDSDIYTYTVNNKVYADTHYSAILKDYGLATKDISSVTCKFGNTIHASDIRNDINIAKLNLDARVFNKLLTLGFYKGELC